VFSQVLTKVMSLRALASSYILDVWLAQLVQVLAAVTKSCSLMCAVGSRFDF